VIPQVEFVENKYETILFDKTLVKDIGEEINRWQEQEKRSSYNNNNLGALERLVDSLLKILDQLSWKIE
jgi:hypothetical protein